MRLWPRRRVYVDDLPQTHDARFLTVFLMVFVLALGALYAVGYVVAGDKVPAGTSVAGAEIGGLTRARAGEVLVKALDDRLGRPVTAVSDGSKVTLTPRGAGIALDVDATLDEAMDGSDWNPSHMLKVIEGGGTVDPVFRTDSTRLLAVLAPLARQVKTAPVSATVTIRGDQAEVQPGRPGLRLDVAAARDSVVAAMLAQRERVALRLVAVAPPVDTAEARAFVAQTIRPALSRSVTITVGDRPLTVTPVQFGPALRVTESAGVLHLGVAPARLFLRTRDLLGAIPGQPIEARIAFEGGRPVVVPSRSGEVVDRASWAAAILEAATNNEHKGTAQVRTVDPAFTTSDAKALHITTVVGNGSATADVSLSGVLATAARKLDATVVLPGADFSYLESVGPLSASTARSALGAAMEAAAERARLTILERAVGGPGEDLRFRNSSVYPVYVRPLMGAPRNGRVAVFVQLWSSAG